MSTTQRLSSLLVATLFIVLLALMATFGVRSADAAHQVEPLGSCPPSFDFEDEEEGFTNGLVTTHYLLGKTGNLDPNREPDPSMDPNGDGWTCLKLVADKARGVPFHRPDAGTSPPEEATGQRAVWRDNNLPL
jgi:hypothetical protein